jgi:hypothetical protein
MPNAENPKASSMNEETQGKVADALEGFNFNVSSGTVEFTKNNGFISIGNGTLESYSKVSYDGMNAVRNSYANLSGLLNIENGRLKLPETKSFETTLYSTRDKSIVDNIMGTPIGTGTYISGDYGTGKVYTTENAESPFSKYINAGNTFAKVDSIIESLNVNSQEYITKKLYEVKEAGSSWLTSMSNEGNGTIRNSLFESGKLYGYPISGAEKMNIVGGMVQTVGASNFLKEMGLPEYVTASESMVVKNAFLNLDAKDGIRSLFIRDGAFKPDPSQRIINGSLSYLNLDANNNISYDASFVTGSVDYSAIAKSTQNILSGVDWNKVGSTYNVDSLTRAKIQDDFLNLSESYFKLYDPRAKTGLSRYPELASLSATEYLNHAALLRFSSDPQKDQLLDEVTLVKAEVVDYLNTLNPDLKTMYLGAIDSYKSKNRDRVRQFSISLRELYTHVVDILSPAKSVKAWSTKEEHFVRGNPTRRARLEYIGRSIKGEDFEKFINTDIDAVLEFLTLLQSGTHSILPRYTDEEMKRMLTRMEGVILLLIKTSRIN